MPFIISRVNVPVTPPQEIELKSCFAKAIELVPGKSEQSLFLCFEGPDTMYLRGQGDVPMAYLTVSIFDNESHAGYADFTRAVTQAYQEILGIAPAHCLIKFDDITGWSIDGQYIDRRMFG